MRQKVCVSSPWVSTHRDLAPDAVKPSQTLVALNGLVTLVTLGGAVPLHPEMVHHLRRGDMGGGDGEEEEVTAVVCRKTKTWVRAGRRTIRVSGNMFGEETTKEIRKTVVFPSLIIKINRQTEQIQRKLEGKKDEGRNNGQEKASRENK